MNLKERSKNTFKNSAIGLVSQILQILSSIVCRVVFVRTLVEAYLGVNGLFANILSILSLGELGIGSAITYELYRALAYDRKENTKSLMAYYKKAYTTIGILIGIAGLILAPFITHFVSMDPSVRESVYLLYFIYLGNTVVSYFYSYKSSIISASQQNYVLSLIHMAVTIAQNIIQCFVLLLTRNFLLYLLIQVSATFLYNLFVSRRADKMFPIITEKDVEPLPEEQKKRMFKNIRDIFLTNVSQKLVNSTDNIIITAYGGLVSTGLNSNYSLLTATLKTLTNKVYEGVLASVGNVNAVESTEKKLALFDEVQFFFFWMFYWCSLTFALLVEDLIGFAFGEKYIMTFAVAVITGLNFYTAEQATVVRIFKNTMGLFRYGKFVSLGTGIINVILSIILGRIYGVEGILFATFISLITTTRWYLPYCVFKYGFKTNPVHFFKRDFRYWAEAALLFFVTWKLCLLVNYSRPLNLLAKFLICLIVPNGLLVLLHIRDRNLISVINRIKKIILRKK
ncbi:MAG: hypothetical protein K6D03_07885 [Solobacterium sp.]|nr:hypothetical protein [Solobacterium sp.]